MSKFKTILNEAKGKEPLPEPEKLSQKSPTQQPHPATEQESSQKRGRPKGKRSDPDYEQVTAYIRKETHTATKIALLEDGQNGQKREFSELIQDLLEQWLKSRT